MEIKDNIRDFVLACTPNDCHEFIEAHVKIGADSWKEMAYEILDMEGTN